MADWALTIKISINLHAKSRKKFKWQIRLKRRRPLTDSTNSLDMIQQRYHFCYIEAICDTMIYLLKALVIAPPTAQGHLRALPYMSLEPTMSIH